MLRFCLTILSVSFVLFSPLSYAREDQKKKNLLWEKKQKTFDNSIYETKKSLKFAPEYRRKFEDETPDFTTRLKERLNQLSNKTKVDKYSIQDKIEHIQSITAKFFSIRSDDKLAFNLLFGSLLTMALYHFCLFGLHRKDISTLYFACLCILTAFLYTTSPERFFIVLFPNFDLEIATKIKFICVYLSFTLFVMFIKKLYPQELSQIMLRVSQGLGVFFTILTLVTSAKIHTYIIVAYEVIVLISSIYLIYVLIRASLRKREGSIWLLGGFFLLLITIINDILFDQGVIYTGRFVPFGVFILFFVQWYHFSKSFAAEEQIGAYSRFVPKEFLSKLDKEDIADVELGDNTEMTMSILFSDIRNFTTLSEQMTPEENFNFINSYLKVIGPVIRRHHGFIDKYIGDAVMALFDKSADDAVRGAIGMLRKLVEYNEGRKQAGYVPIRIGIGINTGSLMIGTIGERGRMEGTVISDAVNLASRIEGMTKTYGVSLLISDQTFRSLEDPSKYYIRKIDRVKASGKIEPVTLWEVFDSDPPDIINYKLDIAMIFEEAVSFYLSNQFEEAQELFQDCLVRNPQDKTAQFYRDRCRLYIKMGVDENWDGIARIITYERLIE